MNVYYQLSAVIHQLAAALGIGMRMARTAFKFEEFTNTIEYLPATASVRTNGDFTVDSNVGFAICNTTIFVTDTSNAAVSALQPYGTGATHILPFLATITVDGENLSNRAVPVDCMFGVGIQPYYWPVPKILKPRAGLTMVLENLSATDRRVRAAFNGFKIFGDFDTFRESIP